MNRLVRLGYGTLKEVKELNAIEVLDAINYDNFCNDYEIAYMEMNK